MCHEVYRICQATLENKVSTIKMDVEGCPKILWHPDRLPKVAEFAADFCIIARRALDRPMMKRRWELFRIYFEGQTEYKQAAHQMGLRPSMFDRWVEEVKFLVGRKLKYEGLWPVGKYFREPENNPQLLCRARKRHHP